MLQMKPHFVYGILIFFFCFFSLNAWSQDDATPYTPAVHTVWAPLISLNDAQGALSSFGETSAWDFEVSDEIYRPRHDSRLIEVANSLGFDPTTPLSTAAGRDDYISNAYLFVRNGVDYNPLFGLHHGAMGAAFHQSGTSFDQTKLFSELLHIANIPHSISVGSLTLSEGKLLKLLGTSSPKTACEMLANGGIPARFSGASDCNDVSESQTLGTEVEIGHAWVNLEYRGQSVILDPSVKEYVWVEPNSDFLTAISPSRDSVVAAIGGVWNSTTGVYSGPNPISLQSFLDQSVDDAALYLSQNDISFSAYEVLGGKRLVVDKTIIPANEAKYQPWGGLSNISAFPMELKAHLSFSISIPGAMPFGHAEADGDAKEISVPLELLGIDPLILSPIHIASPDSIFNFSGNMDADDAAASFELSIIRPGSINHKMLGSTGVDANNTAQIDLLNEASGETLLEFEYLQRETNRSNWLIEAEFNSPYPGENGAYGDLFIRKRPSVFTLTNFVAQSGQASNIKQKLYERHIPQKTILRYGLFVDDSLPLIQCERQRSNPSINFGGGGAGGGGAFRMNHVISMGLAICVGVINNGCADTIHGCQPDQPGGTTMRVGGTDCPIIPGGGINMPTVDSGSPFVVTVDNWSDGGGTISEPITNACIADLQSQFPTIVSHDKMARSKAIIAAEWHSRSSELIDSGARLVGARGVHLVSLGMVSADIEHDYDLSLKNDALKIDVDTMLALSGTDDLQSRRATSVAMVAALSSLEGLLLQKITGSPRVDSAATKADWYAWNANYPEEGGPHYGPYAARQSYGSSVDLRAQTNGPAIFDLDENSTNLNLVIRPARFDLGPAEQSEWNYLDQHDIQGGLAGPYRNGRKQLRSHYSEGESIISVGHIVGTRDKGGAGVKLPEFAQPELEEEELSQERYDALYGKFNVDEKDGFLSFSPNDYLSVGDEYSGLAFSASYEGIHANSGPLGQGWSHNHDGKVVLSTNLKEAFDGQHVHARLPFLVSFLSSYALADVANFTTDNAPVFPQTLMINGWMSRHIYENEAQITFPSGSATFYKLPFVGFVNPAAPNSSLSQLGERRIYEGVKPVFSDNTKVQMRRADLSDRLLMPGFAKIDNVTAEQYFDYSQMGFVFVATDKSIYKFGKTPDMTQRLPAMLTDTTNISCWPDPLLDYVSAFSSHNPAFCGSAAGSFQVLEVEYTNGQKLIYEYQDAAPDVDGTDLISAHNVGTSLSSVRKVSQSSGGSETVLNSLSFEYLATFGVRYRPYMNITGLDDPTDPDWQIANNVLIPDPDLTHGQTLRLHRVNWSGENNEFRTIQFGYDLEQDDTPTARHSPLLRNYTDSLGNKHDFEFQALSTDQNEEYDRFYLLKSFTPEGLSAPIFNIEYSSMGRVTAMTDANGRLVRYGINGVVNRVVNALNEETLSLYDPDGRLIETISAPYADAPAEAQ